MPLQSDLKTKVHRNVPHKVVPSDAPVAAKDISKEVGYGPTNGVEVVTDKTGLSIMVNGAFVDADDVLDEDHPRDEAVPSDIDGLGVSALGVEPSADPLGQRVVNESPSDDEADGEPTAGDEEPVLSVDQTGPAISPKELAVNTDGEPSGGAEDAPKSDEGNPENENTDSSDNSADTGDTNPKRSRKAKSATF